MPEQKAGPAKCYRGRNIAYVRRNRSPCQRRGVDKVFWKDSAPLFGDSGAILQTIMPSRRGHSNSHHGCIQCKTGRVKCDEGQPSCGRCRKKGRTCTYRHLLAPCDAFERRPAGDARLIVRAGSLSSAEGERQDTSETEIGGIHRSPPRFGATGLPSSDPTEQLLLHHYFGHLAALSFGSVDKWDIVPAFRQAVTRHVLTEAYVNQVVLAFAATHLASVLLPGVRKWVGSARFDSIEV
ncbi:Sterol uptake control protein 2 [Colletotrichum viniferum]|nr:Sterol uptake control protein 2 [Colletotrichum viniferum]